MKHCKGLFFTIFLLAFIFYEAGNVNAAGNKWTKLVEESGKVLAEIQKMPDKGIPKRFIRKCEAVAIFPNTVSGGVGIGGKYGQGIIIVRNNSRDRWSSPAIFTLVGGSIGWQIGGQATDVVLLIMSRRSVDGILQGKFKLGADVAVAAGPVGRDAEASIDAQLKGAILSYSRSRGLFIGAKLEGLVIAQHKDGNKILYGKGLSAEEILIENEAAMPDSAKELIRLLNR